ncbi:DinB family protein [Paludifilum halophilum]|uniref:DinB-like domain-containing protein n=1 Tax=Paludifilum halophilum TaxID=1642702 RepID=A0A235B6P5_9BACL|nr:DinB family protein [Paludifilum halophilum]OYD07978.1 hypothetical protein CHM34_07615 [Paludifilum halophilum]
MRFDLHPDERMAPTVGLLHAAVKDTYQRLKRLVEDMNQEEIDDRGPFGDQNSTGQLLRHLAVVDLHWVYRIKGEPVPAHLKDVYGPMKDDQGRLPLVSGIALEELLSRYDRVQEMFREACLGLSDADLARKVPYENGADATLRWGIWHIADHSRYHQAQIAWLKKRKRQD